MTEEAGAGARRDDERPEQQVRDDATGLKRKRLDREHRRPLAGDRPGCGAAPR